MNNKTQITLAGSLLLTISATAATAQTAETRVILESEDWETLKTIWRLINRVKPSDGFSGFPVATEKGDSLQAVIDGLFAETDNQATQINTAIQLISRITSTRIMRLSRMNPSMIMRMAPPWTETVQDNLLFNFEQRITTLTGLAESSEISAAEFIAARDTLLERAETWAVLEILQEDQAYRNYDYYGWPSEEMDTDAILERLDLSYRAALDTLKKQEPGENTEYFQLAVQQHEEFLQKYSEFQLAAPALKILLMDLIEP